MKKIISFLFVFSIESTYLFGQSKNFFFGPPVQMGYQKLGAAKGIAGVIGDNYYVIENDYGGRFDFNNNIRTIITRFSISDGRFKGRFNLNELIGNSRKEINKILFCDVIAWKNKLVGFYTYKNPSGKNFLASAALFDPNGKLIKDGIDIGDFEHDYVNGSFLWQGGLLVNGRNTLSVVKNFQYRMTPDSSQIIVLCSPREGSGNVRFKTYDNSLSMQKEIVATIPLKEKVADMIDFGMDNGGNVYVLTKTYKSKAERKKVSDDDDNYFEVHVLNVNDNSRPTTIPIDIPGKTINNAELIVKNNDQAYCFGNYWNSDNKKSSGHVTGVFSVHINQTAKPGQIARSNYDLPDSVLEYLSFDEKVKKTKANGLEAKFGLYQGVPDNAGGMYVVIANEVVEATVRGTTGAMNSYVEMTKSFIISYINNDKQIKWAVGFRELSRNPEMMTRADRSCFFEKDHNLLVAYVGGHELYSKMVNKENGHYMEPVVLGVLRDPYQGFRQLEKSVLPIGKGEFVIMMFANQLSLAKFKVE